MRKLSLMLFGLALVLGGVGCRGPAPPPAPVSQPPPPPPIYESPDQAILEEAIRGRSISPAEVASLSDRMLTEGSSTLQNDKTMARLDILLTKTLKEADKEVRHRLLRNLGILHYHQKKYNLARQELQQANEIFPRDARTHFYLARLAHHQGKIYQRKGLNKKAKGQFKLAANEMELARKFEPANPLFRQDLKHIVQQEESSQADRQK